MKVALDTNVLAYAEGTNGAAMRDRALELIERLPVRGRRRSNPDFGRVVRGDAGLHNPRRQVVGRHTGFPRSKVTIGSKVTKY